MREPQDEDFVRMMQAVCELDKQEDWTRRLILADWLEENGYPEWADCQRWMAEKKKRPVRLTDPGFMNEFAWFDETQLIEEEKSPDAFSDLPHLLFACMPRDHPDQLVGFKSYQTCKYAEMAVMNGWAEMLHRRFPKL